MTTLTPLGLWPPLESKTLIIVRMWGKEASMSIFYVAIVPYVQYGDEGEGAQKRVPVGTVLSGLY